MIIVRYLLNNRLVSGIISTCRRGLPAAGGCFEIERRDGYDYETYNIGS
jgi:hypothetical protein